jgi:hypothetical protein
MMKNGILLLAIDERGCRPAADMLLGGDGRTYKYGI